MELLIDAGGTSTNVFIRDGKKITTKAFGPGNVINNFDLALKNILEVANLINGKSFDNIYIYVAGYASLDDTRKNKFIKEIKSKFVFKNMQVKSDVMLPLDAHKGNNTALTLGTGTSIVSNFNTEKIGFGYGHIIGDPCSGYEIARSVIFASLNNDKLEDVLDIFGLSNYQELIKYIYAGDEKNKISSVTGELFSNAKFASILDKVIKHQLDIILDIYMKQLLESDSIILNGSVANNDIFIKILKDKLKKNIKIIKSTDRDKTINMILERKW